ncbi:PREDICTED: uncharacterized protein LOC106744999 [Dinoponera quadriceps]|uniref:Uncharacterized protein LOC106744999 n=1 Tax=Dinoponera quadriceps TaxID=609295 RepID=A0A6P3XBL0_DINQU|nr:PREDICTED: uncharacterized protein LOC106744999 [Dinoponera quadriceps]XP_014475680.1 PREDICTED: uncharacterized protein LOC106744999 [Dinoponera quadriceps]
MLNNQKMGDHDEVAASDETFKGINECSIKIEQPIDRDKEETNVKYFDFNLEVNDFLETKLEDKMELRRSKRIKKLPSTKPQSQGSQVFTLQSITAEQNFGSKYRPIRPKPYTTTDSYQHVRSIESKTRDITTIKKKNNDRKKIGIPNISVGTNRRKAKSPNKPIHRHSVELFFNKMAQTVLKLPEDIQAEIKMEICKLVTKAEIEFYESQGR